MMDHTVQIRISLDHYNHLVLTTVASLLSYIVYHGFSELSAILRKFHIKVTTNTAQVSYDSAGRSTGLMRTRRSDVDPPDPARDTGPRLYEKNPINFLLSPDCDNFLITASV